MKIKLEDIVFTELDELDSARLGQTLEADTTLRLSANTDAIQAAKILDMNKLMTIAVVDKNDNIQGVIFPNWIQAQVEHVRKKRPLSFLEAVRLIKKEGDDNAGPGERPRYHHEWLNYDRPVLNWCKKGGHFIDSKTCPYHR